MSTKSALFHASPCFRRDDVHFAAGRTKQIKSHSWDLFSILWESANETIADKDHGLQSV